MAFPEPRDAAFGVFFLFCFFFASKRLLVLIGSCRTRNDGRNADAEIAAKTTKRNATRVFLAAAMARVTFIAHGERPGGEDQVDLEEEGK